MQKVEDVSELRDVFLYCRDYGHAWFPSRTGKSITRTSGGLVYRILVCQRCKTTREDTVVATTGEIYTRRYTYPDGYCFVRGADRVTKQQVRSLAVKAAFAAMKSRRSA